MAEQMVFDKSAKKEILPDYEKLQKRLAEVEKQLQILLKCVPCRIENRMVSNELARKEIEKYLSLQKESGITKVSIVEITEALNLPVEQVESIMEKLFEKGIKEVN